MPSILSANTLSSGFDVANSLRFNRGSSDYLNRTLGTPTNVDKATFSTWVKFSDVTSSNDTAIFAATADGNNTTHLEKLGSQVFRLNMREGSNYIGVLTTNRVFRDPSAWYHIVVAFDTNQGTGSNRIKLYINGVQETSFSTATYPTQNIDLRFNTSGQVFNIGNRGDTGNHPDAYFAETVFIDGLQLAADQFGEFDNSGIWKPIDVSGLTFGNNGFYLDYEADGTSTAFVDSGPDARAITVANNVVHSFAQAKFGGSSIYLDGVNDKLTMPDSNDFDFGTGNFTWEAWIYKPLTGKESIYETRTSGDNNGFNLEFNAQNKFEWYDTSIAGDNDLPRDPNAITANTWTHYAVVRNGAICTMYRDGTSVGTPKDVGTDADMVSAGQSIIGINAGGSEATSFEGFFDEMRLSSVARYTGNFTAPSAAFTSDSDTVFLIQSNASNLIGADVSGTGNHFTSSGLTLIDQSTDTCTNNACTWNTLYRNSATFTQGNLVYQAPGSNPVFGSITTFGVSAGKWYAECKYVAGSSHYGIIGICDEVFATLGDLGSATNTDFGKTGAALGSHPNTCTVAYVINTGKIRNNNNNQNYGSGGGDGDIINIALDRDNRKVYFGINGTYENSGDPAAGSNGFDLSSQVTGNEYFLGVTNDTGASETILDFNFGGGFGQTAVSSANADANGHGNFEYAVPSGFFAWNTKNLAESGG